MPALYPPERRMFGMKFHDGRTRQYRSHGAWGDATLLDIWDTAALSYPEKTCVVDAQGLRLSYEQVDDAAARVARHLTKAGASRGDVVALQLPGWTEFMVVCIACLKTGLVINPVLPNLRCAELIHIFSSCRPKFAFIPHIFRKTNYIDMFHAVNREVSSLREVIVVDKHAGTCSSPTIQNIIAENAPLTNDEIRAARKNRQCSANDLAALLFTSGSEGRPKGVMLTHNNIIASERLFAAHLGISMLDAMFMPAPVAHATGFHHGVVLPMMLGATSVLLDVFTPQSALDMMEKHKCTCGMGATPFLFDIVHEQKAQPRDLSALRFFLCGGAPIPGALLAESLDVGIQVRNVYGSTESVPHTAVSPDDPAERIICTNGKALPGIEVRVVDEHHNTLPPGVEGEEASRGPQVFMGYYGEPGLTGRVLDDDGWYYSGDLCVMDDDGYIRITGRKKDVIIRGGENISSVEVENLLQAHPNVREACVVSMPDPRLGERACAYVVLKDKSAGFDMNTLTEFFQTMRVAKFKYPERIELVPALPRNPAGKVKKYELRADIRKKIKAETGYGESKVCLLPELSAGGEKA